ncbi:hypothetical protein [Actibacterium sp. 188UL27-1]|uniref:hypothetical protein n=1 Tax=Actibacterium sp. 188UL27-1 TaxID=2786961 RepID=UPI00195EF799|nr:hypothetical protein [Actibacterium sp. 188UL27-1]MBM7068651.1 hypothetical protein [Actibacterium sp. 188UL27-1]
MSGDFKTWSTDLNSPVSFGGGGGGGNSDSDRAIDQKMNSDNSTTANSDVSGWSEMDTRLHAVGNIGYRGNNYAQSLGGCTGCHQGAYDAIGGSNPTYEGPDR